jgi:hypothetical protein
MLCLLSLLLFLAGNCGLSADIPLPKSDPHGAYASLFAEELGLVMEVRASEAASVVEAYKKAGLHASLIGKVSASQSCALLHGGGSLDDEDIFQQPLSGDLGRYPPRDEY